MSNLKKSKNEYEKWSKLKFIIKEDDDHYHIKSVDFGAVPIGGTFHKRVGLKQAKKEILNLINSYNRNVRFGVNTPNPEILDKKTYMGRKKNGKPIQRFYYRFKLNSLNDLEFIHDERTIIQKG